VFSFAVAISGRVRWLRKPAVRPFHRVGFHGIDLVALHATELCFASPIGHCHQELFALRAAVIIHCALSSRLFGLSRSRRLKGKSLLSLKMTASMPPRFEGS
jgi:hypothetical protein